jgi:hypothetical protein
MKVAKVRRQEALTMPNKKYIVDLSEAERNELVALTSKGTLRARQMKGAMAKELLPDALWARIAPLLPPEPPKPKGGRPRCRTGRR